MSTTTALAPAPFSRGHRLVARRRHRGLLAVTAVAVGLSIPITGAGSAIESPRPPSLASAIAATSALTTSVAMGKLDV